MNIEENVQKKELLEQMKNSKIKILDIEKSLMKIKEKKSSICIF